MRRRVVIVNWRRPDLTLRAAASVTAQMTQGDRLVVVDNGSGDGSVEALRGAGLDVVGTGANLGFGGGVNAGARDLTEDALVLLNNDAVAEEGFLDALTAPLGSPGPRGRIGASTAKILLTGTWVRAPRGTPGALVARDGTRWVRDEGGVVLVNSTGNVLDASGNGSDRDWLTPDGGPDAPPEVFGFCGGACAVLREAWEEVGPFREDLFMYYEDTEMSWRLREAGWDVVHVPSAVTRHEHAASSGTGTPLFVRANVRNRILVAAAHGPVSMVGRSLAHTVLHAVRGPMRAAVALGLLDAVRRVPGELAARSAARARRADVPGSRG